LSGGLASEALQDFSGGIVEVIELKQTKQDIYSIMEKAQTKQSFMGCSLKVLVDMIWSRVINAEFRVT
jgi:hypothetical protein